MNQKKILKNKKPWPTKAAMEQVYSLKLWGSNNAEFYSGEGSHLNKLVDPYVDFVLSFLKSFSEPLTVCDLGCGDFNVGKKLVHHTKQYFAIDIVPNLIEFNQKHFKADNLKFQCLDIAVDELPMGDCVILRQVLQHLSNTEIMKVVNKLSAFNYLILTEHLPNGEFIPNIDIISGQGIRLKKRSGVDLLASPFNLNAKEVHEVISVDLDEGKGRVVTKLIELVKND
jgi:hypothetical protein